MSLKTRIRGFTAWVNLRLRPFDQLLNNVLMDLLTGTNMKLLLESLTGRALRRLDSMDGLTQNQKMTRVEWVLDELKTCKVIPADVFVDTRMFAMRSADHIFELLWRLVCHDVCFVWERAEYLQQDDLDILTEVPFKWIPEPPDTKKKRKTKTRKSLLSGFGASSLITEKVDEEDTEVIASNYDPFPRNDYMKQFKTKQKVPGKFPKAEDCIMELVNKQLKTLHEGRKLNVHSIDDLVDSRVLCALINSFIPNTFTTEVLLNDRWSINLILKTVEKMFYINSPFDSEDLVEADSMAICSYFCVFFMLAYKYRQSRAVVTRMDELKVMQKERQRHLVELPAVLTTEMETNIQQAATNDLHHIKTAIAKIEKKFDIEFCYKWIDHIGTTVKQMHSEVHKKIADKFDMVSIPRNISVNDMCLSMVINLSLTNGSGFYLCDDHDVLTEGRKLVLRNIKTGEFIDNMTKTEKGSDPIRRLLRLPIKASVDMNVNDYPKYQFYFECLSRNRKMKLGSTFLYQVFPTSLLTWHKVFIKAARENELETVQRMVVFFKHQPSFINCREPQSGNSALHWTCKLGHYDIVQHLLENGANIDLKNNYRQTPLFAACEGLQRNVAHLLIEWGCDIHVKALKGQTAFEMIKNDEFRDFMISAYEHYSAVVPQIMEGDTDLLENLVNQHASHIMEFNNLRSRCINGSSLLHTAAYFSCLPVIRTLLGLGVDINLLDYKGATALHRARDIVTMQALMNVGATPSAEDMEGNTPLHVKCYGETGKPSETEAVNILINSGAKLDIRNSRGLLPLHCAAMQGRTDLISLLLEADAGGVQKAALAAETDAVPPSVLHLAIANDAVHCAEWLREAGFEFKQMETDVLMQRILSEQIKLSNRGDAVKFLLDNNANVKPRYAAGNTGLHFACSMSGSTDVLEVMLQHGADFDAINEEGCTPLFSACQCNNQFATSILLEHGADVRMKNLQGLTAFDFILDYDEWIESGYFSDEIRARLKAYSLKHARDLIRAITKRVKAPTRSFLQTPGTALIESTPPTRNPTAGRSSVISRQMVVAPMLPPLQPSKSSLTY